MVPVQRFSPTRCQVRKHADHLLSKNVSQALFLDEQAHSKTRGTTIHSILRGHHSHETQAIEFFGFPLHALALIVLSETKRFGCLTSVQSVGNMDRTIRNDSHHWSFRPYDID